MRSYALEYKIHPLICDFFDNALVFLYFRFRLDINCVKPHINGWGANAVFLKVVYFESWSMGKIRDVHDIWIRGLHSNSQFFHESSLYFAFILKKSLRVIVLLISNTSHRVTDIDLEPHLSIQLFLFFSEQHNTSNCVRSRS